MPRHARFYDEPVNNLQAHDRKGINRFIHSMYETDEEPDTADDDDIPPESHQNSDSDWDSDDDNDDDYEF